MTAVEYLVANLDIDLVDSDWYIQKAKEMEKQHIIDCLKTLLFDISQGKDVENIEQYYNETFKQQEQ